MTVSPYCPFTLSTLVFYSVSDVLCRLVVLFQVICYEAQDRTGGFFGSW